MRNKFFYFLFTLIFILFFNIGSVSANSNYSHNQNLHKLKFISVNLRLYELK